jgi:hypothetical protein
MTSIKKTMELEDTKVSTKVKISAIWVAILFIFAYVDIFAFYKPGMIAGIQAGKVFMFQITQTFVSLTKTIRLVFLSSLLSLFMRSF